MLAVLLIGGDATSIFDMTRLDGPAVGVEVVLATLEEVRPSEKALEIFFDKRCSASLVGPPISVGHPSHAARLATRS